MTLVYRAISLPKLILVLFACAIPFETAPLISSVGTPARVLGILVGYLWILRTILYSKFHIRISKISIGMFLFTVWALISLSWAKTLVPATSYAFSLIQLSLILFVIGDILRSKEDINLIMRAYTSSAIIVSVCSIYRMQTYGDTNRLVFTQEVGPAHFAASLVLPSLFLLGGIIQGQPIRKRLVPLIGLVIVLYAIILSGTRSALLGFLAGGMVFALFNRRGRFQIVLLMLGSAIALVYEQSTYVRFIVDPIKYGGSGRLDIWHVGLSLIAKNPIIGVGISNFPTYFTSDAIARSGSVLYGAALVPGRDAHNIYLQIFVELGVIGIGLFLISIGKLILLLVKRNHPIYISLLACLVGYLTEGFFLPLLNRKYFWITVGLAIVATSIRKLEYPPQQQRETPDV